MKSTTKLIESGSGASTTPKEDVALKQPAIVIVKTKPEPTPQQQELGCDAFSYYSNKFNLMKTLLLKDDDVDILHTAGTTPQAQGQRPAAKRRRIQDRGVRKTRISFEAHPSLLFDEDFFDMVDQMRCVNVSDDESEDESSDDNLVRTGGCPNDDYGASLEEKGKVKVQENHQT